MNVARSAARITGNFGVSFFSPLVGGNVAESIYDVGVSFEMSIVIALISAAFVTGLAISKEASEWGKQVDKKRK